MKTREEFVAAVQNYQAALRRRRQVWRFVLLAFLLLVVGMSLLANRLDPGSKDIQNTMPGVIFTIVMLLLLSEKKGVQGKSAARRAGLVCPSCGQLFTLADTKLVLTSQNCPHCGRRVFEL